MTAPASLAWFAAHELRLAWRDWSWLFGPKRGRSGLKIAAAIGLVAALFHLGAYALVASFAEIGEEPDRTTLVVISASALMSFALMLSQAMESVTRAFYARADLDLLLSSPITAAKVFAVRIGAIAVSMSLMAALFAAPLVNVLAATGGPRWLAGYGVALAMGALATAVAVALTVGLFRLVGAKRARVIAQIAAAVIGAAFVIAIQLVAIVSYGNLSRLDVIRSDALLAFAPASESLLYWPAHAVMGDPIPLVAVLGGVALLAAAIVLFAGRFAGFALATAGLSHGTRSGGARRGFRRASSSMALRRKEWMLLRRDPWLLSQTLMQLLYLLPPALLLWRSFGQDGGALIVLVPVLVMAAGQLAGGLAWLAVSGEDAPDLVATAPVAPGEVMRAKTDAVLIATALVFAPFLIALLALAPPKALVLAAGIGLAAASATGIQIWFRAQAKRSHFRRRQTSSRIATFSEAFSSVLWACAAAFATAGAWLGLVPAALALCVLGLAWRASPGHASCHAS